MVNLGPNLLIDDWLIDLHFLITHPTALSGLFLYRTSEILFIYKPSNSQN